MSLPFPLLLRQVLHKGLTATWYFFLRPTKYLRDVRERLLLLLLLLLLPLLPLLLLSSRLCMGSWILPLQQQEITRAAHGSIQTSRVRSGPVRVIWPDP